jgi:uncharacterized membrane protein YfcA
MFSEILDMSLLIGAVVSFVSAVIQGYAGFGGGLVIIPILAILFGPVEAIAITAIAALFGNAVLWRDAFKKAYWPEDGPVCVALAISTPLALLFLVSADPVLIRRGMGVFVLVATGILMSGWTYSGKRGTLTSLTVGALAGGVTGGFGIPGGPFMIVYYMSAPVEPPIQRANMIISVGVGIVFLLGALLAQDVYTSETIGRSVVIIPIFMAGAWTGRYLFKIAPGTWYKKVTYGILVVTGIMVLAV